MKFNIGDKVICLRNTDCVSKRATGKIIDVGVENDCADYLVHWNEEELIEESVDNAWWINEYDIKLYDQNNTIKFAKVKPNAIIPSKREEDAGYDIYPCFDEDYIVIYPHETKMIPTGIASAFSSDYVAILKERGSTGTKGIGQRCGVIDSGFRGEYFVPITNHNNKPIVMIKEEFKHKIIDVKRLPINKFEEKYGDDYLWIKESVDDYLNNIGKNIIEYPYEKAICQLLILPVPKMTVEEISYEELQGINSERGNGSLGSSNK